MKINTFIICIISMCFLTACSNEPENNTLIIGTDSTVIEESVHSYNDEEPETEEVMENEIMHKTTVLESNELESNETVNAEESDSTENSESEELYSSILKENGYLGDDISDTSINYMPDISTDNYNRIVNDGTYQAAQKVLFDLLDKYCTSTFCKEYNGTILVFVSSSDIVVPITYDEYNTPCVGKPVSVYTENCKGIIDECLGMDKPEQYKVIEKKLLKEKRNSIYRLTEVNGCICTFVDIVTDESFQMTCTIY